MQLLTCPWCGDREETEFRYGGQAHVAYPADPGALSDAEWAEYLFVRDNPAGPFAERWVHSAGCRRWFNAVRDTATHRVLAVYRVGEPRPPVPGSTVPGSPVAGSTVPGSTVPGSTVAGSAVPGSTVPGSAG